MGLIESTAYGRSPSRQSPGRRLFAGQPRGHGLALQPAIQL